MYTGLGVKMMFVLAKKRESTTIFRLIKDIDPEAFVSQSAVIGVCMAKGFDHIKSKIIPYNSYIDLFIRVRLLFRYRPYIIFCLTNWLSMAIGNIIYSCRQYY